jgi:hypothetical protein
MICWGDRHTLVGTAVNSEDSDLDPFHPVTGLTLIWINSLTALVHQFFTIQSNSSVSRSISAFDPSLNQLNLVLLAIQIRLLSIRQMPEPVDPIWFPIDEIILSGDHTTRSSRPAF